MQKALRKLGLVGPMDFALHVPLRYEDETRITLLRDARPGEVVQIEGVVTSCEVTFRPRRQLIVTVDDGTDVCTARFFNFYPNQQKALSEGQRVLLRGEVKPGFMGCTMLHPSFRAAGGELPDVLTPVYPSSGNLPQAYLRRAVQGGLERAQAAGLLAETLPADALQDLQRQLHQPPWPLAQALRYLHHPTPDVSVAALEDRSHPAWLRLKAEELLAQQLSQAQAHLERERLQAPALPLRRGGLHERLLAALPFSLTEAQRRVGEEIARDLQRGLPMHRLLQGDVGSGKTVVAALAAAICIDAGWQCVLMAPTEILAEQHYNSIRRMLEGTDIEVVQLVGGQRKKLRDELRSRIAAGEAHIVVGTHALFEADIQYCKLGLIVIDEQHRFGVAQRAELRRMGSASHPDGERTPHILVMSATPIPRTLSMTVYGDLDVSVIDELPADRKPIRTKVVFESQLSQIHQFIRDEVAAGRQAYIVYPLVEKSDKLELKSAVEHHETLQREVFPDLRVGLLHGQMLWYEKEDAMRAFLRQEYDILVATTVVEVGIDVPNATIMLVENAERFGLSQLHQLRGRVGRGAHQSYCFLATKDHFRYQIDRPSSGEDRAASAIRLKTMEESTDGFRIAEVDLRLRGPGDVLGVRQSGLPDFHFVDLVADTPMIAQARDAAFALLDRDPHLRAPEHQHAKERLLRLFEGSASYMTVA